MNKLLSPAALVLLALTAPAAAIRAQDYDERPSGERRPFVAAKPAAPTKSATDAAVTPTPAPVVQTPIAAEQLIPNTISVAATSTRDATPNASVSTASTTSNLDEVTPVAPAPDVKAVAPTPTAPTVSPVPTSVYRVGDGDVLDIRILNYEVQTASTLYTVQGGGLLEYPLVGEPLGVAGLTTDDIDARLTAELKRREVFESPQVVVSVRDYVSHTATVTGLVDNPGAKVLRREALPLYVILAEAAPRPDAGQVVINSFSANRTRTIDLTDAASAETLVYAGDVLRVTVRPPQFFYVGGEIGAPGQKNFHAGMTLTQGVLAAGGATRAASGRIRVSRQGADGRLTATEYSLRDIDQGRVPDPVLNAGDRIELGRK